MDSGIMSPVIHFMILVQQEQDIWFKYSPIDIILLYTVQSGEMWYDLLDISFSKYLLSSVNKSMSLKTHTMELFGFHLFHLLLWIIIISLEWVEYVNHS